MSQHDFSIANQGFPSFRSDLNDALQALASNSAGASEPTTTYAQQLWYDSTNNLLKMRNTDNDAWITLAYFDQSADEWEIRTAVIQAVDGAGIAIKTDEGTTRITIQDDGSVVVVLDATINGVTVGRGAGSVASNTAVGASALDANTTGASNVALGTDALGANTTASANTAVGYQAGYASIGGNAVSIGYQAGYQNLTGNYSVAAGYQALYGGASADVDKAVAIGAFALKSATTGDNNVAVGYEALQSNTTASNNTAVGYQAGYSQTTAPNNTIIGYQAGYSKTTGNSEVLIGYQAGYGITTGADNVCIGNMAGYYVTATTTGGANIYIGSACRGSGAANSREIVLGFDTAGKGSNTGFINPNGGGVYQGNNSSSWSTTSDQRLKKNIVDNTEGLDKITAIQVRNFEYRLPEEITELDQSNAVNITGVQLGVIAQELQQVCPDCVKEESTGVLSVDSDNVFWHMVNAIKELKTELDTVKAELATLKGQ